MKIHNLKTWPIYFDAILNGTKNFELRKNDRKFKVGDHLILEEYDPKTGCYTGMNHTKKISYILVNAEKLGLKKGYCIMGLDYL